MEPELKPAMKLTIFIGEGERHAHSPLYKEVLVALHRSGIAGATLTKGVMSYGVRRRLHSIKNEIQMENLPIIIEAVDDEGRVEHAAALVAEMLGAHGLVEIQPTLLVAHGRGRERSEN
jgi:PII-like signaling protein